MKRQNFFIVLALILTFLARLWAQSEKIQDEELLFKVEKAFLGNYRAGDIRHFFENKIIEKDQRLHGPIVVMHGDVTVRGEVLGHVIAVYGDILVEKTGVIEGDAISIGGSVLIHRQAWIRGEIRELDVADFISTPLEELKINRLMIKDSFRSQSSQNYIPAMKKQWLWQPENDYIFARYNRVEGAFLGVQWPVERTLDRLVPFGHLGYGFQSKKWRYELGAKIIVLNHLAIGGSFHDLTDTQDDWIAPLSENNLSAFFFKKDFRDYYRNKGWELFIQPKFSHNFGMRLSYARALLFNMNNVTNWAVFRGGHRFRVNPQIDEGEMHSLNFLLNFDNSSDLDENLRGWFIKAKAEIAGRSLGGDFNFDRYWFDLRRYQPLGWSSNLNFRIRFGTSRGTVPRQFLFDLGGISTLPGYDFKEFSGNRMLLTNFEYEVDGEGFLQEIWFLHPFMEPFKIFLFTNAGWIWTEDNESALSFNNFQLSQVKTDIGIAFGTEDGTMRLSFAQRLDGKGGLNIALRVSRPF